MTTYTYAQLEGAWTQAGGSATLAPLMAAIALAESGGDSEAKNPSGASGPWQIMVPENDQYIPGGAGNVFNLDDNAAAAVAIEKAQGLGAWTTYTSGAYKKFLQSGVTPAAAGATTTSSVTSALGDVVGLPLQLLNFFGDMDKALGASWSALTDFFAPSTWVRAGAGLVGLVLLAFGLVALAKATL